jgi:hypothetical protein
MTWGRIETWLAAGAVLVAASAGAQGTVPPPAPAAQNPSPMQEHTRAHERLAETPGTPAGARRSFAGPMGKPVALFVPAGVRHADALRLVVLFHGAAFIPEQAVARLGRDHVAAALTLGAGGGVYDRAFSDPAAWDSLLAGVVREASAALGRAADRPARLRGVTLVGWSAGYGAIRAILRDSARAAAVDAVVLLDGLHTGYVPEGTVLAAGGALDEAPLAPFARWARAAARGEKRMLVTHSEIFPGTFASTTETTDWLVRTLGLRRTPVLKWGPRGMQQLSEARAGRLAILGFAGNTAPDHVDHLHALPEFLRRVEER